MECCIDMWLLEPIRIDQNGATDDVCYDISDKCYRIKIS
jgi:hypothetical protein